MSRSSAVCVDASLIVRLLVGPQTQSVTSLLEGWAQEQRAMVAPGLLYYEVANSLYQYEKHGRLSADTVTEYFAFALNLMIRLYSDDDLHLRALQLTRRFALPASYDAHYLALAERLGIELWTCDGNLVKKVGADLPWVHLVSSDL